MKTANKTSMLSIKIDPKVKNEAQKVANELGFSLSSIINASLKNLARTKSISYSIPEVPNAMLRKVIRQSEKEIKKGDFFGPFDNVKDFMQSLRS